MTASQRVHERCGCGAAKGTFSLAGTERKYERSRPYRIDHLFIDLTLDFESKSVRGRALLDFQRVSPQERSLVVDAIGFELESVRVDDGSGLKPASYSYDGELIALEGLPERGQLRIDYKATPKRGLYFLAPDEHVKHRPVQAWTQCQDEDARHFIPCVDKPHVKMTTELSATVPAGFQVLSNGEQISAETRGKTPWTYRFKLEQPHPSYLLTLVVGHFDVVEDRDADLGERQVPIRYLVPVGQAASAARSLGETPRMLEFFSKRFGVAFPWQRYSQVVVSDFIFGGMENTTATTLYEHVLLDERAALDISSCDLVAHELAHQWFGDYVTCRDWSHAWLNEGFATFCEHLEREQRLGRDEYDYGVAGDVDTYLGEAAARYQRPIVCRDYAEPIDLFDRHLYEKGGLVLHMLRRELTDPVFFEGVERYLKRHAFGIVETTDLLRALEEVSGRSLERFFDHWVYRPGHPELTVKVSYDDGLLSVALKQGQKSGDTALFALPIEIEVLHDDGARTRHHKLMTEAHDVLTLPLDKRPLHVGFDPEQRVISKLTFEAPGDMLRQQLTEGSNAVLRWTAADALAKKNDPASVKALSDTLAREGEAWMVRVEAARALGKLRSDDALTALLAALHTTQPKVRRAVAGALGAFKKPAAAKALQQLLGKEPSYLVSADAARALGRTRQPGALESLKSTLDQASWADVIRAGTLDGLAALRDEAALDVVAKRTRYGIPTRGRRAAVHALASLGEGRKTREQLEDLLDDKDPHFKIDVVAALTTLGDGKSRGAMRRALDRELDGRVSRRLREALRDLGDNPTQEKKRLNDELESVKDELTELKNRLSKLEGRKTDTSKLTSDAKVAANPGASPKPLTKAKTADKAKPAAKAKLVDKAKPAAKTKPAVKASAITKTAAAAVKQTTGKKAKKIGQNRAPEEAAVTDEAGVRLERRGSIALVTLDRPERMNALSRALVARFGEIGREVAAQEDLRLVIVTGAGDKAFCAGADLKERASMSKDEVRALLLAYESELGWLETCPVPTIAAINGAALGGGLELALLCDLRLAAAHAVLGLPETSLGVIPGAGGTQRLPRLIGEARAKELILRALRLTASEALILGLVNQVLPKSEDFLLEVMNWAEPILNGAPLAIRAALAAMRGAATRSLGSGLALERAAYEQCLHSEDRVEALAAFSEKRRPIFKGL